MNKSAYNILLIYTRRDLLLNPENTPHVLGFLILIAHGLLCKMNFKGEKSPSKEEISQNGCLNGIGSS